jgi:hypothetical protein
MTETARPRGRRRFGHFFFALDLFVFWSLPFGA